MDQLLNATSCHQCGGMEYSAGGAAGLTRCPLCAATFVGAAAYTVDWDVKQKQFDVYLSFPRPEGTATNKQLLQTLPEFIVANSACSCGAGLRILNHSIKVAVDKVEFTGSFQCEVCTKQNDSALAKFGAVMGSVWSQLTRLKVGLDGLEIEKK